MRDVTQRCAVKNLVNTSFADSWGGGTFMNLLDSFLLVARSIALLFRFLFFGTYLVIIHFNFLLWAVSKEISLKLSCFLCRGRCDSSSLHFCVEKCLIR